MTPDESSRPQRQDPHNSRFRPCAAMRVDAPPGIKLPSEAGDWEIGWGVYQAGAATAWPTGAEAPETAPPVTAGSAVAGASVVISKASGSASSACTSW